MPKDSYLTKDQIRALGLLGGFSEAVRGNRLAAFLKSGDLERFLDGMRGGPFSGTVPADGTPGSKLPGVGVEDPLNILRGLFQGIGSDLGKIDRPAGADPAAGQTTVNPNGDRVTTNTDSNGDRVTVITRPDGTIGIWTAHRDGSADGIIWRPDGTVGLIHVDHAPNGDARFGAGSAGVGSSSTEVNMYAGANTREVVILTFHHRDGVRDDNPTRTVWRRGQSPGEEGGGDTNSGRNPLDGIETVGPQSMQQMIAGLKNPGRNPDKLDPNTGVSGITLTKEDKERLGRTVPAAEVVDANSGIDPLNQLNLDPSQLHTRSEKDERVDPNTGLKPGPGKG